MNAALQEQKRARDLTQEDRADIIRGLEFGSSLTEDLVSDLARSSVVLDFRRRRFVYRAGVPAGRVLSVAEALELPQIKHRRLVQKVADVPGIAEEIGLVRGGYRYSDDPGVGDLRPPTLGQHTDEILHELGYDQRAIESLRERGDV